MNVVFRNGHITLETTGDSTAGLILVWIAISEDVVAANCDSGQDRYRIPRVSKVNSITGIPVSASNVVVYPGIGDHKTCQRTPAPVYPDSTVVIGRVQTVVENVRPVYGDVLAIK